MSDDAVKIPGALSGVGGWLDDRFHGARGVRVLMKKVFPDHWSFMLGEIALWSFVILLLTGTFLSLFFVPSANEVVYHGSAQQRWHNLHCLQPDGLHVPVQRTLHSQCIEIRQRQIVGAVFK